MKAQLDLARRTLAALGYKVWLSESGRTLNAKRGQNHVTMALQSGNVRGHRDVPINARGLHKAVKGPFEKEILKEFKEKYRILGLSNPKVGHSYRLAPNIIIAPKSREVKAYKL